MKTLLPREDYEFIFSRVPRVCVDLLIRSGSWILLGRRTAVPFQGKFGMPGGRIMFGERIAEAAQRIATDEIGCGVQNVRVCGHFEYLNEDDTFVRHSLAFICSADLAGKIKTSPGCFKELAYFDPAKVDLIPGLAGKLARL